MSALENSRSLNTNAPVPVASADAAAEWLTRIMSGEMGDEEYRQWQQWRDADPDHERAWQHIEKVSARLRGLHPGAAYQSLSSVEALASPDRRKLLGLLLMLGVAGGTGFATTRTSIWRELSADYRTGVGEQREITLDDGTQLWLNTASAVDIRFDGTQRLLRLHAGEVMIATGHQQRATGAPERPFIVTTREGSIRALGTRFLVRQQSDSSHVAVLESAVEIVLVGAPDRMQVLQAGESVTFQSHALNAVKATSDQDAAWTKERLIASDVRLADFISELSRYRRGVMRCDPAVADLRFSGVFPLRDPEKILTLLPNSLPVKVRHYTRYWTLIEPAT